MLHSTANQWKAQWAAASGAAAINLYALVDSAADPQVISRVRAATHESECMFGYAPDTPIAASTPRLVSINDVKSSSFLAWLLLSMPGLPVGTLLASPLSLADLAAHLRRCIDVDLEGLDSVFLAVWDPAILGALVGQPDDETLHVAGPVLNAKQQALLLGPINHWWYCDRDGQLHDTAQAELPIPSVDAVDRIALDDEQTDALVEASVPDHLIAHIRQNQPELLERMVASEHHRFMRQQLARARTHGLVGTGDLVNYVCIALAYGARFDEVPFVAKLLLPVQAGSMTFKDAISAMDEVALEAAARPPTLLS